MKQKMKLVRRTPMRAFSDVLRVLPALNEIARQCQVEGWPVERGLAGSVILRLVGGEVHYISAGSTIEELVFEYETRREVSG